VRHIAFDWSVDTDARVLSGTATYALQRIDPSAPLWLDTRGLTIRRVEASAESDADAGFAPTEWTLTEPDPVLGQGLRVELGPSVQRVRVHYSTTEASTGLQWLTPSQTADGTHPFLYTQSQAIHARSWFPCQDSPGVRITYEARVDVPSPLTALMSARRRDDGSFEMPEPIPAYLVALAVGRVEFRETGPRSGVWAESSLLSKAAYELAEVERMIDAAEALYGPYRWERYDVLFLPSAFPFGGMENPRLTFATPTILAGDRSLTSLIAHELAHSWSGNLVTNATWDHLWLNEGFTVYIERRIVEALHGPERAQMEAMLGHQDLLVEIAEADEADERLRVDLRGRDPDDGLTDVPYEKGALFLRQIEETYGRDVFDPFLRRWFDDHAFTSVTTAEFEGFLRTHLLDDAPRLAGRAAIEPGAWIDRGGLPATAPVPHSDAFTRVDDALARYVAGDTTESDLPVEHWTAHEWLHFLRAVPVDIGVGRLRTLDAAFGLTGSGNYEILAQWLDLSIRASYPTPDDRLEQFLRTVGRRKFLVPLYRALLESGREADAQRIYGLARAGYHAITQRTLDTLVVGTPEDDVEPA
jgi:aminopeptidase N